MKRLISNLRENATIKKLLFFANTFLLFLYVFSIPSFSNRPQWSILSYFIMAALICVSLVYLILYGKLKIQYRLLILPLFVIWSFIGTAIYSHEFRRWFTLFLMMITFYTFIISFINISKPEIILKCITLGLFLFTLYFLFIYKNLIKSAISNGTRLGSYFDNDNAVGGYCIIGLICSLYLGLLSKKKANILFLIPSLVFLLVGYLTGSRTFILLAFCSLLIFSYLKFKKHKIIFLISLIVIIGLFFLIINMPFMSTMKYRLENSLFTVFGVDKTGSSKVDGSSKQRVLWQLYGIFLGSKNALIGYGTDGFSKFSGVGTYTHGNFAEMLCDFGIIGLVSFYLNIIIPFSLMFKSKNEHKWINLPLFVYFILESFLGVFYYTKNTYIILALMFFVTNDVEINSKLKPKEFKIF